MLTVCVLLALGAAPLAARGHKHVETDLIQLAPWVERYEPGDTAEFTATLEPEFAYAFSAVTLPDGEVTYVRTAHLENGQVKVSIPLASGPGRYQVEMVVRGTYGNQVAANIDVFAGEGMETPAKPSDDFDDTTSPQELGQRLFDLTNDLREQMGRKRLPWDPTMFDIALEHAEANARVGRLAHVLPDDGGSVADRAKRNFGWQNVRYGMPGYPAHRREGGAMIIGDNLAACANAELAIFLLAESPGHRVALLTRHADAMSIGVKRRVIRKDNQVIQAIFFCMVFVQANDSRIHEEMSRARRLLGAFDGPGGELLSKARLLVRKKKISRAVPVYRQFLETHPDSPVTEDVQEILASLVAEGGEQLAEEIASKQRKRCRGKIQVARNFMANAMQDKAEKVLEEVLSECAGTEFEETARAMLVEIQER